MVNILIKLGTLVAVIFIFSLVMEHKKKLSQEEHSQIVKIGSVNIWSQSFGDSKNPAILLIIGAGVQSILWPDEFCEKLVNQGFFIIRYDHRDTGRSSMINYDNNPYKVMDLAKDALAVLDSYKIVKAHIVGFSMGGQIAQFIGAYFPERALTLTLIATSSSFEEGFNAFEGKNTSNGLSPPKAYYVKWAIAERVDNDSLLNYKIRDFIQTWKLLNGSKAQFDEDLYLKIAQRSFARSPRVNSYANHAKAMKASFEEHKKASALIRIPTLIIHGTEDPVFGIDHAKALNKLIKGSQLDIVKDMGHALSRAFFDQIIKDIVEQTKKVHN